MRRDVLLVKRRTDAVHGRSIAQTDDQEGRSEPKVPSAKTEETKVPGAKKLKKQKLYQFNILMNYYHNHFKLNTTHNLNYMAGNMHTIV